MAMATTVGWLLQQHPNNPIKDTYSQSDSSKSWAKEYPAISKVRVHTSFQGQDALVANFDDAFIGEHDDESLRLNEPAHPPNYRSWRLNSEADGVLWFHTEISNVVLSAFASCPGIIQASHEKVLDEERVDQIVDTSYSIPYGNERLPVAIGEFKRGLLRLEHWQSGRVRAGPQATLSRELRGYAHKYKCPQVFCFDNHFLLMLQFRARSLHEIKDAKCEVDCWMFPRDNFNGTPLRYAFYRFLVQGFRRCQGSRFLPVSLHGYRPSVREFNTGRPLWKLPDGKTYVNPWNHTRKVDPSCGAFYWTGADGCTPLLDQNGNRIWDTGSFWEPDGGQDELEQDPSAEEDLYGPE